MAKLKTTLRQCLESYSAANPSETVYINRQNNDTIFIITTIRQLEDETLIETGIALCIDEEHIIIDREISHRPLLDALLQVGVSRKQIILQYLGETLPREE